MSNRTFLFSDNTGPDFIHGAHTTSQDVVRSVKNYLERVGQKDVDIVIEAKLSPVQCAAVLKELPQYKRCFQESGNLVMLSD